jgi:hypothetical protein
MWTRVAIALLLLVSSPGGTAAPGNRERARLDREARENPEYYGCGLVRDVAGGRLTIGATVGLDGRATSYSFWWEGGAAREGLSARYLWSGPAYGPADAWHATFRLATRERLGFASMVLLDAAGRLLYEPRFGGSYGGRSPGSSLRYYTLEVPASILADALRTRGAMVELRSRRRLPAVPIDPTPLAEIQRAIAGARREMEARIADYRNRCEPGRNEALVVT